MPNIWRSSKKNLFSHLKPCRCRSSIFAGTFLYASTISVFAKMESFQQRTIEKPKFLADDIVIFSKARESTLSLKLLPSGRDTFMQILVLLACGMARIELALNSGTGGVSKGPATKSFEIQSAMVSDTSFPYFIAAFEFFTLQPFSLVDWKDGPPFSRKSTHFWALLSSDLRRLAFLDSMISFRALTLIRVSGFLGMVLDGKFSQNVGGVDFPYSGRVGMFGNFFTNSFDEAEGAGSAVCAAWVGSSQFNTMDQSSGRPRSLLEADNHDRYLFNRYLNTFNKNTWNQWRPVYHWLIRFVLLKEKKLNNGSVLFQSIVINTTTRLH
jgi:hypothetical protein